MSLQPVCGSQRLDVDRQALHVRGILWRQNPFGGLGASAVLGHRTVEQDLLELGAAPARPDPHRMPCLRGRSRGLPVRPGHRRLQVGRPMDGSLSATLVGATQGLMMTIGSGVGGLVTCREVVVVTTGDGPVCATRAPAVTCPSSPRATAYRLVRA